MVHAFVDLILNAYNVNPRCVLACSLPRVIVPFVRNESGRGDWRAPAHDNERTFVTTTTYKGEE
jgi:hypothetical protein